MKIYQHLNIDLFVKKKEKIVIVNHYNKLLYSKMNRNNQMTILHISRKIEK